MQLVIKPLSVFPCDIQMKSYLSSKKANDNN
jgi:hypothetical protein